MGFFNQPTARVIVGRTRHWSWDEAAASHELARRARSRKRANTVLGACLLAASMHPVDVEQLKDGALATLCAAEKGGSSKKPGKPVFEL